MNKKFKTTRCCMCKTVEAGHGHNAQPAASGRCCTQCNWEIVIPLRVIMRETKDDPEFQEVFAALADPERKGINR